MSVAVVVLAPIVLLVCVVAVMKWRMLQPDMAWAKAAMHEGDPLAARIDAYRDASGGLPPDLATLGPMQATGDEVPSLNKWKYGLLVGGSSYELSTTHGRWVSAFDMLLLRPDRTIPPEWRDSEAKLVEYDVWIYVVAAELLPSAR